METLPFEGDAFDQKIGLTNAILNNHDTGHVKARYHARRNRVLQLDSVLRKGPRPGNEELLQEREKMITAMKRYRVALSPHKFLPTEIWQTIFHYVSAGYNRSTPCVQDPLVLCGVFSSWRNIVMNMPELWNTVHFSVDDTYTRKQKLAVAQLWFSRAADLPLSMTLMDTPTDKSIFVDFVRDLIAPLSHRFRYLHVVLHPSQIDALLSLPAGSLDCMEECSIVANSSFDTGLVMPWESPVTFFSPLAHVRKLRLHLSPLVLPHYFLFPWHRLESFRCDSSIDSHHCLTMLTKCQSLKRLHIRIFGVRYLPPPTVHNYQILLPNLRSVSIQLCDQESYDNFFLPIILPSLKSLWIYNYDGVPWSPGMYSGLLNRSGCSLEHISLASVNISESQEVLRLIQLTPELISLTFSQSTPVTPDILYRIGRGEIGASLIQLFLKGRRDLDPLLTMLEMRRRLSTGNAVGFSRTQSPASLNFIETYCDPEEILRHTHRIQDLRHSGYEISLLNTVEGHHSQI